MERIEEDDVKVLAIEVRDMVEGWKQAEALAKAQAQEAARVAELERLAALRNTPEGFMKDVKKELSALGVDLTALPSGKYAEIDAYIKKVTIDHFMVKPETATPPSA